MTWDEIYASIAEHKNCADPTSCPHNKLHVEIDDAGDVAALEAFVEAESIYIRATNEVERRFGFSSHNTIYYAPHLKWSYGEGQTLLIDNFVTPYLQGPCVRSDVTVFLRELGDGRRQLFILSNKDRQ
jgi:hypothetical protein